MGKTEVECCDVTCIHNENVKLALEQMPDEELLNSLADFYKAFADGTRVKILYVLQKSENYIHAQSLDFLLIPQSILCQIFL